MKTFIDFAREADLDRQGPDAHCRMPYWTATDDELIHFAFLVREDERATMPPMQPWQNLTKQQFLEAVDGLEDLEDCWTHIQAKLCELNNDLRTGNQE